MNFKDFILNLITVLFGIFLIGSIIYAVISVCGK